MTTSERIWLEVSYDEQNTAKAAGARWDRTLRAWYAPRPGMTELQRWVGRAPLPDVLDGEDRSFGDGLFVDLIPDSCWFTNVRSRVGQRGWDRLRRMVYRRAKDRCEACGAGRDPDVGKWLEAHERWEYDEATRTQRLRRIVCLCSFCHEVTHYGLACVRGRDELALRPQHSTGRAPLTRRQPSSSTRRSRSWSRSIPCVLSPVVCKLSQRLDPSRHFQECMG